MVPPPPASTNRITSTIHFAPSSHPAASASPSGERPAVFLISIKSIPGPPGNSTRARAVPSWELSAAQWSAVEPARLCAERRDDGTMGRSISSNSVASLFRGSVSYLISVITACRIVLCGVCHHSSFQASRVVQYCAAYVGARFDSPVWPLADAICSTLFPFSSRASPTGAVPKQSMKDLTSSRSP